MIDVVWTQFWDMHSGGGTKEPPYEFIYIEAPESVASLVFYNRFGHSPDRVSCTCCGEDYSVSEREDLAQLTAYHRGCRYAYLDKDGNEVSQDAAWKSGVGILTGYVGKYIEKPDERYSKELVSLEDYLKQKDVLFIYAKDITEEEKKGSLPLSGYQWFD